MQGKGDDLSRELVSAYLGDPRLAPQRLGQQPFKARVLVAYGKLRALHYAGTEWAGEGRCDPN